jgi:hypothetical protein
MTALASFDDADERHLFCGGGLEPCGYVALGNKQSMARRDGIRVPQTEDPIVAEKNAILGWVTEWAVSSGLIR